MAKYQATPLTRKLSDSAGEETFYQLNGQNIAKMKINSNHSRSEAQVKQRLIWKRLSEFTGLFHEASVIGFPKRDRRLTPDNAFVQESIAAITAVSTQETSVDYAKLACAKGWLKTPTVNIELDAEQHTLVFSVKPEYFGARRKATDRVYALILEKEAMESELHSLGNREGGASVTFQLPDDWAGDALAVYIFAVAEDGKTASDSKYVNVG